MRGARSTRARSALRIVREPLDYFGIGRPAEREARARSLLERVGLTPDMFGAASGQPEQWPVPAGGDRPRAGAQPDLLVCDEPVSALDLSVQAQILQLLHSLQRELGFGMLFISHNLAVVEALSQRVVVMDAGLVVEVLEPAPGSRLADEARHPVTRDLLAAIPRLPGQPDRPHQGAGNAVAGAV